MHLVENEEGKDNWSFSFTAKPNTNVPSKLKPRSGKKESKLEYDSLILAKIALDDISVDYRHPGMTEPIHLKIDECNGAVLPGKPISFSMRGILQN